MRLEDELVGRQRHRWEAPTRLGGADEAGWEAAMFLGRSASTTGWEAPARRIYLWLGGTARGGLEDLDVPR